MSEDASYELQKLMVQLVRNDGPLTILIEGRFFDHVPRDPATGKVTAKFPYISFGPEQEIQRNAECIPGSDFVFQIDVWSREVGFPETKRICSAVEHALDGEELEIGDNALVSLEYGGRRILRDSDGLSSHGVMTFRAMVEKR
ncbi:DUF3168 domain-containing protein [Pararhizobium sp. BT-229]|uniref:DUF3168 domain-containing protein n=1 Tax=Pararhizobium sp. BT-229 TaxID=2986923 RepID=UPI0021F6DDE3|nr:DUF3168 domain-containing protein [Pararhizobium sp. BT-229]MCV9965458.1 DUF3168 domain-containing protein [Pararhizobium sp. BT-229]